jgi:hypothetical protein
VAYASVDIILLVPKHIAHGHVRSNVTCTRYVDVGHVYNRTWHECGVDCVHITHHQNARADILFNRRKVELSLAKRKTNATPARF